MSDHSLARNDHDQGVPGAQNVPRKARLLDGKHTHPCFVLNEGGIVCFPVLLERKQERDEKAEVSFGSVFVLFYECICKLVKRRCVSL